mmetsp:Transcript_18151/g.48830  ORF Transcript_18151/g.48830 Transcript_18151/m.48830 type:complete len:260 (-) Transcript_18151:99-878(-)
MRGVARAYASVLVTHSASMPGRGITEAQERAFFENLYTYAAEVLKTAFDRRHWLQLENELGRIFRSGHFNLAGRKNAGEKKLLKARDLHKLRTSADAFMQQSASTGMPRRMSIHAVIQDRSPVLTTLYPNAKERLRLAQRDHDKALAAFRARVSARRRAQTSMEGANGGTGGALQAGGDGQADVWARPGDENEDTPDDAAGGPGDGSAPLQTAAEAAQSLVDALEEEVEAAEESLDAQLERAFYASPFDADADLGGMTI